MNSFRYFRVFYSSFLLITAFSIIAIFGGCLDTNKYVQVEINGSNSFPPFIVGTWKENNKKWEIHFKKDGTISKTIIEFGEIELYPGKKTEFPTWFGGKGVYEPGKWSVRYDNATQELYVEIIIEHFYQDISKASLEGKRTDILSGRVNKESKTWEADWYCTKKYFAKLEGVNEPNQFEDQEEPVFVRTVFFEKVE